MIAYKGTENLKCYNLQYQVGKTYIFKGSLKLCKYGFHACKNIADVNYYYSFSDPNTIVLEIEIPDDASIIEDNESDFTKFVTNKFRVLRVLTKKDIEEISNGKVKFDKNGNLIYIEYTNGQWTKFKYSENNILMYKETSNGKKQKFDKNGNEIYYEFGDYWEKHEYNNNGQLVFYEDSTGIKKIRKYNNNNQEICFEEYYEDEKEKFWKKTNYDSKGRLIFEQYSDGIAYAYEYYKNETRKYQQYQDEITLKCTIYNDNGEKTEYIERKNGKTPNQRWKIQKYDRNGRLIYLKAGEYTKELKYDDKGNLVFCREITDRWYKQKFDENGNMIEYEHSCGFHERYKYDDNGNCIYYKNSDGNKYEIVIE